MDNLLYFRKFRPVSQSFTITSTDVSNWANIDQGSATSFMEITGVGGDDIVSESEIKSVTVTSAGSNSNVGSNISGGATVAGETVTIPMAAVDIGAGSRLRIEPATGSGNSENKDTADGYTLAAGDIVTVTLQIGTETCVAYPESRFIVANQTSGDTITALHFKSLKGNATDDIITLTHTAGKFESVVKAINDGFNGNVREGKLMTMIDGGGGILKTSKAFADCGVTGMTIALESGY